MNSELTTATLDLFQPHTLIETIQYQATAAMSDCWERRHINAMVSMCEYVSCVYPTLYKQIKHIHERFIEKQEDI